MTKRREDFRRTAGADSAEIVDPTAFTDALRRIWTAVKERLLGVRPEAVPVPVRVDVRSRRLRR
jgi:hypothetical protein